MNILLCGKEQQKDRKRMNRKMSNRNDYGHQGYKIYLLLSCGCTVCCEKVTDVNERVEFRKLKIQWIKSPTGEILFDRPNLEKLVRTKLTNEHAKNLTRAFRNYMNIEVDNRIFDILVNNFNCLFNWKIKKSPDHEYMPTRLTVVAHITSYSTIEEKEIIEQGCVFNDHIKIIYGGNDNVILTLPDFLQRLNSYINIHLLLILKQHLLRIPIFHNRFLNYFHLRMKNVKKLSYIIYFH